MPMNPNFLCCIGAELKNSTQQTTRMTQVYLYRAFEDDTIADMLSPGFFDEALGIIRKDDLLLLYSPNETPAKYVYARVSNVDRDGVTVEKVNIRAAEITVDTTGYSNISGDNLQEIIDSIDSLFNDFVKIDGSSIMTAPLKFASGSLRGAIGPAMNGVQFYGINAENVLTSLAALTTLGIIPTTDNALDMGSSSYRWKDAHIARVITGVINNGYDINVPVTASPDTLALKSEVDNAANSGDQLYSTGVWYAKMYSGTTPPASAEIEGRNYADFSQTDSGGNPIIVIYTYTGGAWTQTATITPPADYNGYMTITSKIWDISEQAGQQGGKVLWSHNQKTFTPYPQIISFENAALTGTPTTPTPTSASPDTQVANKEYVDSILSQLSPSTVVSLGWAPYILLTKDFIQADFNPSTRPTGSKTALRFMAGTVLKTPSGDIFEVGDIDFVIEISTIVQGTALAAGDKVYIYLVSNGDGTASPVVSKSATYSGYMIGGFAMLCPLRGGSFTNLPASHPYYSYSNSGNQIMHTSVWHLKNAYDQNLGVCVYNSEKRLWVQAYIPSLYDSAGTWQSGSYSTSNGGGTRYTDPTLQLRSVYNVAPSNNMTFGEQSQWLKMAGGRYIFDDEFTSTAEGSNEQTNVNGSNQKNAVGGWYDTANRPMISNFGAWEMNGFYWQDIAINAAGGSAWASQGLNKGQTYGGQRLHAGANWDNGTNSGSLSRSAGDVGVGRYAFIAARGASPCYEII